MANVRPLEQSPKTPDYFHPCRSSSAQKSKKKKKYLNQELWGLFCFIFVFAAMALWHLRPLGWCEFYHHHLHHHCWFFKDVQKVLTQESTLPLPILASDCEADVGHLPPHQQKRSFSTITIGQTLQSLGWSWGMRFFISHQNGKVWYFEPFPTLIGSSEPHPHHLPYLSTHFWRKQSKEKSVRAQHG